MGLKNGILLAVWLTTAGAGGTLFVLLHFYSPIPDVQAWAVGLLPVMAGYIFVAASVVNLYRKIRNAELVDAVQAVKNAGRYVPVWVTAAAWSTFWATGVLFYYK
jgi:xanthosine utilization system XapX-like protein